MAYFLSFEAIGKVYGLDVPAIAAFDLKLIPGENGTAINTFQTHAMQSCRIWMGEAPGGIRSYYAGIRFQLEGQDLCEEKNLPLFSKIFHRTTKNPFKCAIIIHQDELLLHLRQNDLPYDLDLEGLDG